MGFSVGLRIVVCVVFFVVIAGPCDGQLVPGGHAARVWGASALIYLADTFMKTPKAIFNTLQQGFNAFNSVHTMVSYLYFGFRVCCATQA